LVQPVERAAAGPASLSERFSREALARQLNAAQLEAVMYPPRPLLVVAGAGSGKTRVITFRLARLLAGGDDPRRVMVVTFTNKAAGELRERAGKLLGIPAHGFGGLWIGTFHALCARMLRRWGEAVGLKRDFVVYDDDDQKRLLGRVLADLQVPERLFPVRQVLSAIDRAKNQGVGPDAYQPADYFDDVVGKAYAQYEARLRAANATDFGGLLVGALRLMMPESPVAGELADRFDHVLVDEFQDTNTVQYRLVRFLSRRTHSLTVVGDEDQSIYKWRGADIRNILDFERDHPGAVVVKLEQNYRSTGRILRAANAIIARNTERREKRLYTEADAGDPIVGFEGETERDEAEFVAATIATALSEDAAPRDFAVFYRTNGQSRVLEEALRGRDIPYVVVGGTRFYDRAEIKDLVAYLRVLQNPADEIGLLRIVNVPARGIGDATVERVVTHARKSSMSLWDAMRAAAGDDADAFGGLGDAGLGTGPRKKLAAFVELMNGLRAAAPELGVAALAEKVLEDSGYRDALAAEASLEAEGRMENLLELVAQMREYEREAPEMPPTLAGFLERIALASDVDGYDPDRGAVSLMTVHTAKGLEFPWVFITGLEENVFPHARSIDDDAAIEEERRLCYVAVTRAMRRLFLSRVRRRRLSGQELPGIPSRFLRDLPADAVETIVQPRPSYLAVDSEGAGPWAGRWSRDVQLEDSPPRGGRSSFGGAPARGLRPGAAGATARGRGSPALQGRPRPPSGQIRIEYDDGAGPSHADHDDHGGGDHEGAQLGLRIGARLRHPQFGVGEVRGWQSAGADLKVTMRFSGAGVKTILARFLTRA
jgi:DNA helicase II / ATP-dependent DNA helicase PcrA